MTRFVKKFSRKTGLPPGTLVHIGKGTEKIRISVIDYDRKKFLEKELKNVEGCFPFKRSPSVTWINVDGVHDIGAIEKIGKHFNIHPLVLEDIVNTGQRPKMENMGDYIYIVFRMLEYDENDNEIKSEQISIILGRNFVISFQEKEGDIFDPLRERIRNSRGRIRKEGNDYLAYALLDTVIDNYFIILEKISEKVESVEEDLMNNPGTETLQTIHKLKKEMIFLRKSVWPLREVVSGLERLESPLIKKDTGIYLRDVYDHTIRVVETVESFRDLVSGMRDTYLSSISNRTNEVMKVLTIIATVFIPLTFIAGIYGMNFQHMPELGWEYGYFAVWLVIVIIAVSMAFYFRRKGWL